MDLPIVLQNANDVRDTASFPSRFVFRCVSARLPVVLLLCVFPVFVSFPVVAEENIVIRDLDVLVFDANATGAKKDAGEEKDVRITLTGKMTDAEGNPVANVEVRVVTYTANSSTSSGTRTDDTGVYRMEIRSARHLFLDAWQTWGGDLVAEPVVDLEVKSQPRTLTINRTMLPPKTISGTITWGASRKPSVRHAIELIRDESLPGAGDKPRYGHEIFSVRWIQTDEQGRYTANIPPGRYILKTTVDRDGGRRHEETIELSADSPPTVRDFHARRAYRHPFRCKVVDTEARPVAETRVYLHNSGNAPTDVDGEAVFNQRRLNSNTVWVCEIDESKTAENSKNRTIIRGGVRGIGVETETASLVLRKPVSVHGRVLDSDLKEPMTGLQVSLDMGDWIELDGGRFQRTAEYWDPVDIAEDGSFHFDNVLVGGSYRLVLSQKRKLNPDNENESIFYRRLGFFSVDEPEDGEAPEVVELPEFHTTAPISWNRYDEESFPLGTRDRDFVEGLAEALDFAASHRKNVLLLFSDYESKGNASGDADTPGRLTRNVCDYYACELTPFNNNVVFNEVFDPFVSIWHELEDFRDPPEDVAFITEQLGIDLKQETGCVLCVLDDTGKCLAKRSLKELSREGESDRIDANVLRAFLKEQSSPSKKPDE